jgi:hypothetical protein
MDDTTKRFSDFDETFSYGLPRTAEEVAANLPSRLKGALYLQPKGSPGENNTDYRSTDSPGPDWYRLTFARSATVYCLAVGPSASATGNMKFLANDNWKNVYNNNTDSTSTSGGTYYIFGGQSLGNGTNYGWQVNNGANTTLRNVYLYEKEIIVPEGETVELVTGVYGTALPKMAAQ